MRLRFAVPLVALPLLLSTGAAQAKAIQNDVVVYPGSNQAEWLNAYEYKHLMEELGLIVAPKVMNPSNTLGVNGFDMGLEADTALIHGQDPYWTKAAKDGSIPRIFSAPTLRVRKGLPFSIEGGMNITYLPFTQQQVLGGDGRFALHEGYALVPNVALQLSYSKYVGNQQLDMDVRQGSLTMGYTWPFGETPDLKTGRISAWVGYSKGDINSNIRANTVPASDRLAFLTSVGTDGAGHLLIRYDKWITGLEVESGHFSFLVDGEFVDGGIPTINARWGAEF
ncbi:MAG TPA: hypothetical protein VMV18_14955 [bacterium]|nr:hypothetical protein [bacterium]